MILATSRSDPDRLTREAFWKAPFTQGAFSLTTGVARARYDSGALATAPRPATSRRATTTSSTTRKRAKPQAAPRPSTRARTRAVAVEAEKAPTPDEKVDLRDESRSYPSKQAKPTRRRSPRAKLLDASYILPIRRTTVEDVSELTDYLRWLDGRLELIVVDGSPPAVFEVHARAWEDLRHVAPKPELLTRNGKVWGVLSGIELATHERLIIADDDVRYDEASLDRVLAGLDDAALVRPQNYFEAPAGDVLPWHARWDTARSLINRVAGGDWPGTLAVRRSVLKATDGDDGNCLFENLELARTIQAAGGRELLARDLYVRRLPPTTRHFFSQRVRQAYDELARPGRFALQLALLPASVALMLTRPRWLLTAGAASIAFAEYGRRRDGGARVFPATASLFAPAWLAERAVCSWLALYTRLRYGGVRYNGRVITKAATSTRELSRRHADVRVDEAETVASR